jgi:ribosome-associated protein
VRTDELTSQEVAEAIARHADDKKALDIVELDLRGVIDYTDYFVICTGTSDRQVKAIGEAIRFGVKQELGVAPRRVEGLTQARWVLMDYLDVIVHIFVPEVRAFYDLERLWGEVPARARVAATA